MHDFKKFSGLIFSLSDNKFYLGYVAPCMRL